MRLITTLFILCFGAMSYGQQSTVIQGSSKTKTWNRGWIQVDSGLVVPTTDTIGTNRNLTIKGDELFFKGSGGSWISASSGNGSGPQLLELSNDTLRISGGNSIVLPLHTKYYDVFSGGTSSAVQLSKKPINKTNVLVLLNSSPIDPLEFSLSGKNVQFGFLIESSDLITIYYNSNENN